MITTTLRKPRQFIDCITVSATQCRRREFNLFCFSVELWLIRPTKIMNLFDSATIADDCSLPIPDLTDFLMWVACLHCTASIFQFAVFVVCSTWILSSNNEPGSKSRTTFVKWISRNQYYNKHRSVASLSVQARIEDLTLLGEVDKDEATVRKPRQQKRFQISLPKCTKSNVLTIGRKLQYLEPQWQATISLQFMQQQI